MVLLPTYTHFQWPEDRQGFKDILIFHSTIGLSGQVSEYQESSIGTENIAHFQSIENKFKSTKTTQFSRVQPGETRPSFDVFFRGYIAEVEG